MKRLLLVTLTLSMLLSLFACNKNEGKKEGEDGEIKVVSWATHLTDKQITNSKPNSGNKGTVYDLYMVKGETEGCQLVVNSNAELKKAYLDFDADKYADKSITMNAYIMNKTHTIKRKDYADAAIPYYGRKYKMEADKSVPYIVEFTTTAETPEGDYAYTYEFKDDATDTVYATFTVNVHVWNIVLPAEKTFASSVGINTKHIERYDRGEDMYNKYYDLLLDHNISAHDLPYDIMSEEAEAYMSDPRVTSFVIGLWVAGGWEDEELVKYYNRIKENPEWFKKAIFYVIDEPTDEEALTKYRNLCERLERLCPGVGVIAPFYTNEQLDPNVQKDQVDQMASSTILWCPKLCLWDDSQSYDKFLNYTPEKSFADRMKEFQAEGDTVWSYVCNAPSSPYAQLFVDTDGLMQRLMMWQHYQRDIEGFLYWGTTSWGFLEREIDPWKTVNTGVQNENGTPAYGDGFLLYPGTPVGIGGPVASIRIKLVRDGIDDIELLYLAEKEFGKEWVMEKVNEITPTLTSYTSEENFYKIRKEIGDALEAALKNK